MGNNHARITAPQPADLIYFCSPRTMAAFINIRNRKMPAGTPALPDTGAVLQNQFTGSFSAPAGNASGRFPSDICSSVPRARCSLDSASS